MAPVTPARPFWLRPKWVVGHVLVVVLVVAFVSLGLWQLRRLDERQARNAEIAARSQIAPVDVTELAPAGSQPGDVEDLEYRQVVATGSYDPGGEVLIRPRSLDGVSGWHVVTPLVLDDGRAVLVTRGFAPLAEDPAVARAAAAPPEGEVTVTGLAFPTQVRQGIGPADPAEGTLPELARVDIARIDQQYPGEVLPFYVQLLDQDPPLDPRGLPQRLPLPATDEGPHLAYAVQWFLFAGVGAIGWPVLLRRTAEEVRRSGGGTGGGNPGGGVDVGRPSPDGPRDPVGAGHS
ncbi:MAG: Cytochrome oxidase biogenesis protein Surf1, facilitates heme A insertion [uncultured Acidimicrobiales bacterium]|uniref:SURF1-like protein n=1 Tax=uncultured Acidimicrobiales bacterium TaxID=310071 RepID=A0A6J4ICK3_9ACTN|nr:MAG: Cytochrome oxidase biogenesis protein Surf1, facilitates heme A insertion [uncultured Acidimicrobiales bacterium]